MEDKVLRKSLPAGIHWVAQVHWLQRVCARLEVSDVKVRQSVVDEAVHGAVRAVHVLVDKPRDEVRGEGDDKGLREINQHIITHAMCTQCVPD